MANESYTYVKILDYKYCVKPRNSFSTGKIMNVLDHHAKISKSNWISIIKSFSQYSEKLANIKIEEDNDLKPHWNNRWVTILDAVMLYVMVAELRPRFYVEVGSGTSTKFVAQAIRDNDLPTKIISIDPGPRSPVDNLCDVKFRKPLEEMDIEFFKILSDRDMLIVDDSHRAFANSDSTCFFCEILPNLPKNLVYAIHDIALPNEIFTERYYNEQYMLAAYLLGGGGGDELFFPESYIGTCTDLLKGCKITLADGTELPLQGSAGFFWMRRGGSIWSSSSEVGITTAFVWIFLCLSRK